MIAAVVTVSLIYQFLQAAIPSYQVLHENYRLATGENRYRGIMVDCARMPYGFPDAIINTTGRKPFCLLFPTHCYFAKIQCGSQKTHSSPEVQQYCRMSE